MPVCADTCTVLALERKNKLKIAVSVRVFLIKPLPNKYHHSHAIPHMLTCIDRDTMQCVSAEKCCSVSKKGFICNDCHAPVFLVLDKVSADAPQTPRFFRHVVEHAGCGYSIRNPAKTASSAPAVAPVVCKPPNALGCTSGRL